MRNIDLKIYFGLLWVMMPCSFVGWKLILCEKLLHRKWWIGFTQNVNKHLPNKTVSTCNNTSVFLSLPLIFNVGPKWKSNFWTYAFLYRVSQEKWTKLRESVPYVKLYRYNPKYLCPKLNGFRDNGKWSLKLWQLLHTYSLPNSYWNWQEYVVSVMLISVLNIKVTCEWHKAIKLNYKNTRTHVMVVLRVTKHYT